MSATASPYGLQPISSQGGLARTLRMPNGIASGMALQISKFQAVTIDTVTNPGTLIPVTNPGNTPQKIFGVFAGVSYTPRGAQPTDSPYWPAGTTYDTTFDMLVYVWPASDPELRYAVQADGSVSQILMGSQFNITNLTANNTPPGVSLCTVGAAGIQAGSQGQFVLEEFLPAVGDPASGPSAQPGGDAFTDLIVRIAYPQIGAGFQTSIG